MHSKATAVALILFGTSASGSNIYRSGSLPLPSSYAYTDYGITPVGTAVPLATGGPTTRDRCENLREVGFSISCEAGPTGLPSGAIPGPSGLPSGTVAVPSGIPYRRRRGQYGEPQALAHPTGTANPHSGAHERPACFLEVDGYLDEDGTPHAPQ